jgi:acetyl-CoA synthetase-like protein
MSECQLINPIVNRWCREAQEHGDDFWARAAATLHWFRTWDRVFEWEFPTWPIIASMITCSADGVVIQR